MVTNKYCLLCCPFFFAMMVDMAFTLDGQSARWWNGDWTEIRELNPIGRWVLGYGPEFTVWAFAMYGLLISGIIMLMPRYIAAVMSFTAASSHIMACHSWCETFNAFRIAMAAMGILAICVVQYLEESK